MTFFTSWGSDQFDDLVNAIADTLAARAAEIAPIAGMDAPTVHNVIYPRALAVNTICVDWGGADIDEADHKISATIEIQYLYRALQRETADRAIRIALNRIRRYIVEDRLRHLKNGGWSIEDSAMNVGTIADADFYENPDAKRYEGGKLTITMSNFLYRR